MALDQDTVKIEYRNHELPNLLRHRLHPLSVLVRFVNIAPCWCFFVLWCMPLAFRLKWRLFYFLVFSPYLFCSPSVPLNFIYFHCDVFIYFSYTSLKDLLYWINSFIIDYLGLNEHALKNQSIILHIPTKTHTRARTHITVFYTVLMHCKKKYKSVKWFVCDAQSRIWLVNILIVN